MADITDLEEQINPDTLQLVYQESVDKHANLMADVDRLNDKGGRWLQMSFIFVGALLAFMSSDRWEDLSTNTRTFFILAIVFFAFGSIIIALNTFRGRYFAGTVFPHILQEMMDRSREEVQEILLESLAQSYYYNYNKLQETARRVEAGIAIHIVTMGFLIFIALVEAFKSLINS